MLRITISLWSYCVVQLSTRSFSGVPWSYFFFFFFLFSNSMRDVLIIDWVVSRNKMDAIQKEMVSAHFVLLDMRKERDTKTMLFHLATSFWSKENITWVESTSPSAALYLYKIKMCVPAKYIQFTMSLTRISYKIFPNQVQYMVTWLKHWWKNGFKSSVSGHSGFHLRDMSVVNVFKGMSCDADSQIRLFLGKSTCILHDPRTEKGHQVEGKLHFNTKALRWWVCDLTYNVAHISLGVEHAAFQESSR